jgi:hypothetical protein
MKKINLEIPTPLMIGNSVKFWRSEIEHEKARLRALAMGQPSPTYQKPEIDNLVAASDVAKEFAISGRTLARRIKEIEQRNQAA